MAKKYFFGFTLIEVLVAVAIIAILIMLVIGTFIRQIAKGNDARRKADLDRIKVAVEEYEKDHNCYPLVIACGGDERNLLHPYLNNVPCDPVTRDTYGYDDEADEGGGTCPRWFRIYAALQNSDDTSIIPKIGPGAAYNYYVSSPNAPYPAPLYDFLWGCVKGVCKKIYPDENGKYCEPNYPDQPCGGGCGSGGSPECLGP